MTTRPAGRRTTTGAIKEAVAAGGVVVRPSDRGVEVAIAGRRSDGTWVFPKGTPDGDETTEETALREVREETGLEVKLLSALGTVEYTFRSRGDQIRKRVHFFLMEPTGGDTSLHDREYDEVRWVHADEARRMLSFETYRDVLDRALAALAA